MSLLVQFRRAVYGRFSLLNCLRPTLLCMYIMYSMLGWDGLHPKCSKKTKRAESFFFANFLAAIYIQFPQLLQLFRALCSINLHRKQRKRNKAIWRSMPLIEMVNTSVQSNNHPAALLCSWSVNIFVRKSCLLRVSSPFSPYRSESFWHILNYSLFIIGIFASYNWNCQFLRATSFSKYTIRSQSPYLVSWQLSLSFSSPWGATLNIRFENYPS